jgi:hypothetical protein
MKPNSFVCSLTSNAINEVAAIPNPLRRQLQGDSAERVPYSIQRREEG